MHEDISFSNRFLHTSSQLLRFFKFGDELLLFGCHIVNFCSLCLNFFIFFLFKIFQIHLKIIFVFSSQLGTPQKGPGPADGPWNPNWLPYDCPLISLSGQLYSVWWPWDYQFSFLYKYSDLLLLNFSCPNHQFCYHNIRLLFTGLQIRPPSRELWTSRPCTDLGLEKQACSK